MVARVPNAPPNGPVAFFGLAGAWTHMAARAYFGPAAQYQESSTIAHVFEAVSTGAAPFGVVPIENSTEGGVNQTVDELMQRELRIRAEIVLEIAQCLLGLTTDLAAIHRVASHPQGLAQCRHWLAEHLPHAEQVAALSTTAAARDAAQDPRLAAISSAWRKAPRLWAVEKTRLVLSWPVRSASLLLSTTKRVAFSALS